MGVKDDVFELKLYVGDEVVANSTDLRLWQMVFARISNTDENGNEPVLPITIDDGLTNHGIGSINSELEKFCKELNVDIEIVKGACDPITEEPFMHLDMHFWSEWSKKLPQRGSTAISSIVLSATLLALWVRKAKLDTLSLKECQKVLVNIGVHGKNHSRSIKNCEWLQLRQGNTIQINPAEIKKAIEVARAFCEKRSPDLTNIN